MTDSKPSLLGRWRWPSFRSRSSSDKLALLAAEARFYADYYAAKYGNHEQEQ